MRTTQNTAGYLILLIMLFSALAFAQEIDKTVLWSSDALSKVMRTDTPPTSSRHMLRVSGARDEIVSFQAVVRSLRDIDVATAHITDLKQSESKAVIPASAVKLQWVRYIDINRNTAGIPDDELIVKAPASVSRQQKWHRVRYLVRGELQVFSCMQEKT